MGVARLKRKDELNYRRGTTARYCDHCNHMVRRHDVTDLGHIIHTEYRCRIMGLERGRLYRIHPRNVCDAFEASLKG